MDAAAALARLDSSSAGLASAEAEARLIADGPNQIAEARRDSAWRRLGRALRNPVVILLAVLAALSMATGDPRAATIMGVMIVLGVSLRFVQETRADHAAAALKAMISVTATVVRDGAPREIPLARPRARRRRPALGRRHDPGRSPHPHRARPVRHPGQPHRRVAAGGEVRRAAHARRRRPRAGLEARTLCFLGTSVESGTATGVVVGHGTTHLSRQHGRARSSARGADELRPRRQRVHLADDPLHAVMVPLVFLINGVTKHDWRRGVLLRARRGRRASRPRCCR